MKLRNLKSGDEYATIRTENQKEEHAKRINDLSKIEKKIIKYSEDLTAGMQAISSVRILLEIYRPNYVDLTLVDLPGIYYGEERMTTLIKRVYTEYISNPQSIVLYVTASNNDLNTGEALAMARKVDPDGLRTLMIATKIDMREKMTFAKQVKEMNSGLGMVCVRNRTQEEVDEKIPYEEVVRREATVFQEHDLQVLPEMSKGVPKLIE